MCRWISAAGLLRPPGPGKALDGLLGEEGLQSSRRAQEDAALVALEFLVREDAGTVGPDLLQRIALTLDPSEAEALSAAELKIYATPAGNAIVCLGLACRDDTVMQILRNGSSLPWQIQYQHQDWRFAMFPSSGRHFN